LAKTKVIIAGAGVAGLSAAHELAKHPTLFDVHVYEKESVYGGKSASQSIYVTDPGKGKVKAPRLGEHGFRFFPWFYRHLSETLVDIPLAPGAHVLDALKDCSEVGFALKGTLHRVPRGHLPGPVDFLVVIDLTFNTLGASPADIARIAGYHLKFHCSCHTRRAAVYEFQSWADFTGVTAGEYQPHFAELLETWPLMLVAMRASKGSARTLGNVGIQMLYDFDRKHYDKIDAVLGGPTSKVWLEPWVDQLDVAKNAGSNVHFHSDHELIRIELAAGSPSPRHVQNVVFKDLSTNTEVAENVSGGYCICALPINAMAPILTSDLTGADAALAEFLKLVNEPIPPWSNMIGVQYYLDADAPMASGHCSYPGSAWALTSISQPQYWRPQWVPDLGSEFKAPALKGVLSVIACDWDNPVDPAKNPGTKVPGKSARQCNADEVKREIWRQLVTAAYSGAAIPPNWFDAHIDDRVDLKPKPFYNPTPILIHPPGSYPRRPPAELAGIDNLMLAGDYVKTNTELATMEGANEAAKRAVLAIYAKEATPRPWPEVHELAEDALSEPARRLDCVLFEQFAAPSLMDIALGGVLVWSLEAIPPEFDTFIPDGSPPRRVNARSPEGREFLERSGRPLVMVPNARVVYASFPHLEQLPPDADANLRHLYGAFLEQRDALAQFGENPTADGYRQWHDLLAPARGDE